MSPKAEAPRLKVALKRFTREQDFERERGNLDKIRRLGRNKHITQNLASFSQGEFSFIIFP